jgi:hypothetical protein
MPFVDTNDNVFLYQTLPCTRIRPGHGAPGGKDCLPHMREYLTAAKKEYLANDTAEGLVQRMRAAFPSFDGDVLLHHSLRFLFPKS